MLLDKTEKRLANLLYTADESIKDAVYLGVAIGAVVEAGMVNDSERIVFKQFTYRINEIAIIDRVKLEKLMVGYFNIINGVKVDDSRYHNNMLDFLNITTNIPSTILDNGSAHMREVRDAEILTRTILANEFEDDEC